jgi:cytochrome c oxidase subunit 2
MMRGTISVFSLSLLLCGCGGMQSALEPHGPAAADIAILAWVLFAIAAIVMFVVLAGILLAIRGPAALRSQLARERAVYVGGIAFPVIVLTALLGYGVSLIRASTLESSESPAARIEVIGEQWWWRVAYIAADGSRIESANEIRIPVGEEIEFILGAADVIHSFWIPALGGKMDMIPGRVTHLRLRADHGGIYRGQCAEYCGGPHALMALQVKALPPEEHTAWLAAEAAPAMEPATEEAIAGKALFLAAGCGGCHAIRGTEATGTIGPDLTHIGSRSSVGAETLPLNEANLARFIEDGQHVKPGNRMPPFGIFSDEELASLAAYLAGLR